MTTMSQSQQQRHDDAIASLMEEMGQKQGYHHINHHSGSGSGVGDDDAGDDRDNNDPTTGPRSPPLLLPRLLLPELDGYPATAAFLAGSRSIWNPLVAGGDGVEGGKGGGGFTNVVSTNPSVEVIRRRVFEKFRHEAEALLQDFQDRTWRTTTAQIQMRLPIPSMLERWHMDAKLQELCGTAVAAVVADGGAGGTTTAAVSSTGMIASTARIVRERVLATAAASGNNASGRQQRPPYDPVLLSPGAPPLFLDVLRPEVEKAWKVVALKKQGPTGTTTPAGLLSSLLPPKYNKKAQQVQKALHRLVCEAVDTFERQLNQEAQREATMSAMESSSSADRHHHRRRRRRPKIVVPANAATAASSSSSQPHTTSSSSSLVQVTFSGVTFRLHKAYLEKLQRLYDRTNIRRRGTRSSSLHEDEDGNDGYCFEDSLFCLLCRYDTIQGAGLQAGVPGAVMDVLLRGWGCKMECFASPFNCRYDRFASAYYDVDGSFGSVGSFFDYPFAVQQQQDDDADDDDDEEDELQRPCCYQANPPFCEGLILRLNDRISEVLASSSPVAPGVGKRQQRRRHCRPVMFVVFVPAWTETACHRALLANPYLTRHLLLKQGKHWYTEGTQHRRGGDTHRVASFDTSVLFFQNGPAQEVWNLHDGDTNEALVEELRLAFSRDPDDEGPTTERVMIEKTPPPLGGPQRAAIAPKQATTQAAVDVAISNAQGGVVRRRSFGTPNDRHVTVSTGRSNSPPSQPKHTPSSAMPLLPSRHDDDAGDAAAIVVAPKRRKGTDDAVKTKADKRRWTEEGGEERAQQLALLQSLGLSTLDATGGGRPKNDVNRPGEGGGAEKRAREVQPATPRQASRNKKSKTKTNKK